MRNFLWNYILYYFTLREAVENHVNIVRIRYASNFEIYRTRVIVNNYKLPNNSMHNYLNV